MVTAYWSEVTMRSPLPSLLGRAVILHYSETTRQPWASALEAEGFAAISRGPRSAAPGGDAARSPHPGGMPARWHPYRGARRVVAHPAVRCATAC